MDCPHRQPVARPAGRIRPRANSTNVRFARGSRAGVWQAVFAALAKDADLRKAMIDSTIVRAHRHAAGAQRTAA